MVRHSSDLHFVSRVASEYSMTYPHNDADNEAQRPVRRLTDAEFEAWAEIWLEPTGWEDWLVLAAPNPLLERREKNPRKRG